MSATGPFPPAPDADVFVEAVETTVHGRHLVVPPDSPDPAPLLVGFHGYGENAATQLQRLRDLGGSDRWLRVSIQGLHRFYARDHKTVVASWMTSEDRLRAIDDNLHYIETTIERIRGRWATTETSVFAGFSQGVSMAFRAAAHRAGVRVLAVAGTVPPELDAAALGTIAGVVFCRGESDHLYSPEQFDGDVERLRAAGAPVDTITFQGGHEWPGEISPTLFRLMGLRKV